MSERSPTVTIVGCGVSGLTTGVLLREAGVEATIVTRDLPAHTTSDVAAAVWYPTTVQPMDRALEWGRRSLNVLYDLAGRRETGVYVSVVREYLLAAEDLPFARMARGYHRLTGDELPADRPAGFRIEVPRVEPPLYLRYLTTRYRDTGGAIVRRSIDDLASLAAGGQVVVNCTGLEAHRLVPDPAVYPIRGQVVMTKNPGIVEGIIDETDPDAPAYVLPRTHEVVLGGTRQEANWSLEPDPGTTERILAMCRRLEPKLEGCTADWVRVGLRPGRTAVRVEAEEIGGGVVVHNYGHGGSGYTLSWGCAEDTVALVRAALA